MSDLFADGLDANFSCLSMNQRRLPNGSPSSTFLSWRLKLAGSTMSLFPNDAQVFTYR